MAAVVEDYAMRTSDGNEIIVPEVELHRCTECGVTVIPRASGKKIKEFKALQTEQLSPAELHEIFEKSDLTQKDFAEALGLGEKTFHRWLKGTQKVSRSMGYYLRAMDQFPEVFGWVKSRGWKETRQKTAAPAQRGEPPAAVFAALHRRETTMVVQRRAYFSGNPATMLSRGAVHITSISES